jgi:hypothetical protein
MSSPIILPNQPEELRVGQGRVLAVEGQVVLQQAVVTSIPMTVEAAEMLVARLGDMIAAARQQRAALQEIARVNGAGL